MKVVFKNFQGMLPAITPRNLALNQAQVATNVDLSEGTFKPFYGYSDDTTLTALSGLKAIYKVYDGTNNFWVATTARADFVPAPVTGHDERFYWTDGVHMKKSNLTLCRGSGPTLFGTPDTYYFGGVPAPTVAPTFTVTNADSGTLLDTVSYCWTWVTPWGEESAPSPASLVKDVSTGQYNVLTTFQEPYLLGGPYNVIGIRIYRVNTGTDSNAEFQLINDLNDSADTTYIKIGTLATGTGTISVTGDAVTGVGTNFDPEVSVGDYILCRGQWLKIKTRTSDTVLVLESPGASPAIAAGSTFQYCTSWMASPGTKNDDTGGGTEITPTANLGDVIEVTDWTEPDDAIEGLVGLSNGCMAAFTKNKLVISEPGYPFTHPYYETLMKDIVGLGVIETMIIALTKTYPYRIDAYNPENVTKSIIQEKQACIFKRSIVSGDGFVLYISPDGLICVTAGSLVNLTRKVFTKDQWKSLLSTDITAAATTYDRTVVAFLYDNQYFAFFEGTDQGFVVNLNAIQEGDLDSAYVAIDLEDGTLVWGGYVDAETDNLYLLVDVGGTFYIKIWEGQYANPTTLDQDEWHDEGDEWEDDGDATYSDTVMLQGYYKTKMLSYQVPVKFNVMKLEGTFTNGVTVKVYGDGVLLDTDLITDEKPYRFSGIPCRTWEVYWSGYDEVYSVAMADSMDAMARE